MATSYFARLILTQRNFTCTQFISHSYDLIMSEVKKEMLLIPLQSQNKIHYNF